MIDQIVPFSIPAHDAGALVLLSGGQDSSTCLHWALNEYSTVHAVAFDYGQRHRVELEQAALIAAKVNAPFEILTVPALSEIGGAALTSDEIAVAADATGSGNAYAEKRGLPSTFVPARNAILLATAAALAARDGLSTIVTGVCEADDAGYPDCRADFIFALEAALRLALDMPELEIAAPLLRANKALTFKLADDLGCLDDVLALSHTCYEGDRSLNHDWGYGCGECPACLTRADGFRAFAEAK